MIRVKWECKEAVGRIVHKLGPMEPEGMILAF